MTEVPRRTQPTISKSQFLFALTAIAVTQMAAKAQMATVSEVA